MKTKQISKNIFTDTEYSVLLSLSYDENMKKHNYQPAFNPSVSSKHRAQ